MLARHEKALITAVMQWWKVRRPHEWREGQHMEDPAYGCPTDRGRALANAVGKYLKEEKGGGGLEKPKKKR